MTIDPHDEHGDRLRRVLQSEVDSFVPSGDGLERIRSRIEKQRVRRALLATWWLKPALAAFGAVAVAGSATVAAPLLQEVGDSALGVRSPAPQASDTPVPGQAPPAATSPTPTQVDPNEAPSPQPSVTAVPSGTPSTAVECYPNPRSRQDTQPKNSDAKPSGKTSPPSSPSSPSASPSVGPTCAPGSSPTATITPTPSPSDCADTADGCPSPSPTSKPPSPTSPSP